jgi:hypothetical protein
MYGDEKFRRLSRPQPNAQTLWLYLITGDHTTSVPGLFIAGEAQLSEALGWPLVGFRKAWNEIEAAGMAHADWDARVVWLPNAVVHNEPENPNVVRGWRCYLDEIPACALKTKALAHLHQHLTGLGEGFAKPFREGLPKPFRQGLPNQEQEQEQEQEYTPQPPAGGGRITRAERQRAEELRRLSFGCTHDPRCANYEACIVTIVQGLREQAKSA